MKTLSTPYIILKNEDYLPYLPALKDKLSLLKDNSVTYQKEIHRESRFAICRYVISFLDGQFHLEYDAEKSRVATVEKKANTDPSVLHCDSVKSVLLQFLSDIGDASLTRVEVKLIQTENFPFIFNPHRDSQFWRLRHIKYLATVLVSCSGIEGGEMRLFHSQNDKIGPFDIIEELPAVPGAGYIVNEPLQIIFHGMKPAYKLDETAHRAALLLRFFE